MGALSRSRQIMLSSPWGVKIHDSVFSNKGILLDQIDAEIDKRLSALSIQLGTVPESIQFGDDIQLSGKLMSKDNGDIGPYPLMIEPLNSAPIYLTTDPDGKFSMTIPSTDFTNVKILRIKIIPDLLNWNMSNDAFPVTETSTEIDIKPLLISLTINKNSVSELKDLDGMVEDFITSLPVPIDLVQPDRSAIRIDYEWTIFNFPRIETMPNAPYITRVGAVFTFYHNDAILFAREVKPVKDGGLNWEQAHKRAADKLMKLMSNDQTLIAELANFLNK